MDTGSSRRPLSLPVDGQRGVGLVEALIAIVIFGIGALGMAAVALQAGHLTTETAIATDQSLAAEQVFVRLRQQDFDAVDSGTMSVQVGDRTYAVDVDVTSLSSDTKRVVATVPGVAAFPPETFRTVLHRPTGYPSSA